MDKIDFVDMIEQFVLHGDCPLFDVLIVDEAQIWSLQWRMIHEVMRHTPSVSTLPAMTTSASSRGWAWTFGTS